MKRYKYCDIGNINDFSEWISCKIPNVNLLNMDYICVLYDIFVSCETRNIKDAKLRISKYISSLRNYAGASIVSEIYWKSLGWTDIDEIRSKISEIQKRRSPLCKEHYDNSDNSSEKISEIQSFRAKKIYEKYTKEEWASKSRFGKKYWLDNGYSETDAIYECRKRNGSCRECYNSDEEYNNAMIRNSNRVKQHIHNFPEKYFREHSYVSNEEIDFFNKISKHIYGINHTGFVINVRNSRVIKRQNAIVSDGYIKCDEGIILIEYDGSYWHDVKYDEERDLEIFRLRKDIIGVIRVSDIRFHNEKIEDIIKLLEYAIENIKSKKSNRELIY